jgi:hypothetical protein
MDRREREAIMRTGVSKADTPRDRAAQYALETDLEDSPLKGRPLQQRLRNFRPDSTTQLLSLGGPLAWMRRLREIELGLEDHERRLREMWVELSAECDGDAEVFGRRWREVAEAWTFYEVNDLIERHNRNFPAEARLPMNPRTGDFVEINGRPYRRDPIDAAWVLERFPLDIAAAADGAE